MATRALLTGADGLVHASRVGSWAPRTEPGRPLDVLDALQRARPRWMADAACQEHPEVEFFVERGGDQRPAKAVCRGCLVREECLAYALEHQENFGVWGALSAQERRALSPAPAPAAWQEAAPPACEFCERTRNLRVIDGLLICRHCAALLDVA